MSAVETKLEMIARHVLNGRQVVERQRRLVASQKGGGRDSEMAERLLDVFEQTLAMFERELAEAQPPQSR